MLEQQKPEESGGANTDRLWTRYFPHRNPSKAAPGSTPRCQNLAHQKTSMSNMFLFSPYKIQGSPMWLALVVFGPPVFCIEIRPKVPRDLLPGANNLTLQRHTCFPPSKHIVVQCWNNKIQRSPTRLAQVVFRLPIFRIEIRPIPVCQPGTHRKLQCHAYSSPLKHIVMRCWNHKIQKSPMGLEQVVFGLPISGIEIHARSIPMCQVVGTLRKLQRHTCFSPSKHIAIQCWNSRIQKSSMELAQVVFGFLIFRIEICPKSHRTLLLNVST